jgi:hypothetical protein
MSKIPGSRQRQTDIFERLEARGIRDYGSVKTIVSLQIPQAAYLFVRQFGSRTLEEVHGQIGRWKDFLRNDLILQDSQRAKIIREINQTEFLVCAALMQSNSKRVGNWELQYGWIPTGKDEFGNSIYNRPALRITARHRETLEIRHASVPDELLGGSGLGVNHIQKAFEALGLWHQLRKGSPRRYLVSSRKAQGWPMYTRVIIPRLYEFLAPHYSNRGHHSEKRDRAEVPRKALFPKELLLDMLEILQMEHPHVFGRTTLNQLKANIQRHLGRNSKSIKSAL